MQRNRAYYRWQRNRTINRKIRIIKCIWSAESVMWALEKPGKFAKGKIHCSCWMCRTKSYDCLSHRDEKSLITATQQMASA